MGVVPGAAVLPGVPAVPGVPGVPEVPAVPLVAEVPFVLAPEVLLASGVPCVPPVLPGAVSAGASVAGGGVVCAMASEPSASGILHAVVKIKRFMCFSFCLTEMVISPLANLVPAAEEPHRQPGHSACLAVIAQTHVCVDMIQTRYPMKTRNRIASGAVIVALMVGLTACSGMSRQGRNTAIGAGVGAVGGSVLTGGSVLGTVGGAAVGGVVGHEASK